MLIQPIVWHQVSMPRQRGSAPPAPPGADRLLRIRRIRWRDDVLVLMAIGEVDAFSSPLLRDGLQPDVPPVLVLDLSEVTFLGVAGLRVLHDAVTRTTRNHRRIGIVAATPPVERAICLLRTARDVPVYPSLADAVRELPLVPLRGRVGGGWCG